MRQTWKEQTMRATAPERLLHGGDAKGALPGQEHNMMTEFAAEPGIRSIRSRSANPRVQKT